MVRSPPRRAPESSARPLMDVPFVINCPEHRCRLTSLVSGRLPRVVAPPEMNAVPESEVPRPAPTSCSGIHYSSRGKKIGSRARGVQGMISSFGRRTALCLMTFLQGVLTGSIPLRGKDTNTRPDATRPHRAPPLRAPPLVARTPPPSQVADVISTPSRPRS